MTPMSSPIGAPNTTMIPPLHTRLASWKRRDTRSRTRARSKTSKRKLKKRFWGIKPLTEATRSLTSVSFAPFETLWNNFSPASEVDEECCLCPILWSKMAEHIDHYRWDTAKLCARRWSRSFKQKCYFQAGTFHEMTRDPCLLAGPVAFSWLTKPQTNNPRCHQAWRVSYSEVSLYYILTIPRILQEMILAWETCRSYLRSLLTV